MKKATVQIAVLIVAVWVAAAIMGGNWQFWVKVASAFTVGLITLLVEIFVDNKMDNW